MGLLDAPGLSKKTADLRYPKRLANFAHARPILTDPEPVMSTPPTVGALTTTTSITGTPRFWPTVQYVNGLVQLTDYFTITGASSPIINGTVAPGREYVRFNSLTNSSSNASDTRTGHWNADFIHDGTQFELKILQSSGASVRVWVNGQLVSAAALSVATTSNAHGYTLFTFASRASRHIRIESKGDAFGGVVTPAADAITRADVAGPLVLIIADSFGEGANGVGAHSSFIRRFARRMNWPRTISSAVGGTGYLNTGSPTYTLRAKFRDRLANDVIPIAPDLVIWTGGHNDTSYNMTSLQAEALACYQTIQAALPNTMQIVTSPLWGPGPELFGNPALVLQVRDAVQAAATTAGLTFIDALQGPLDYPISTTLSSASGVGAASLQLPVIIPPGSYVDIENRNEFRRIQSVTGGGPYAHTLSTTATRGHAAGVTIVRVGQSLWTGTGNAGAVTGDGNSDFLVSNDAVHPTKEGQDLIGDWLAINVARVLQNL